MPKKKTHKATVKRFNITKAGKVIHRKPGQDHFNARESGNVTRGKRRDLVMENAHSKTVKKLTPYN